jgi:hypothetical protein
LSLAIKEVVSFVSRVDVFVMYCSFQRFRTGELRRS